MKRKVPQRSSSSIAWVTIVVIVVLLLWLRTAASMLGSQDDGPASSPTPVKVFSTTRGQDRTTEAAPNYIAVRSQSAIPPDPAKVTLVPLEGVDEDERLPSRRDLDLSSDSLAETSIQPSARSAVTDSHSTRPETPTRRIDRTVQPLPTLLPPRKETTAAAKDKMATNTTAPNSLPNRRKKMIIPDHQCVRDVPGELVISESYGMLQRNPSELVFCSIATTSGSFRDTSVLTDNITLPPSCEPLALVSILERPQHAMQFLFSLVSMIAVQVDRKLDIEKTPTEIMVVTFGAVQNWQRFSNWTWFPHLEMLHLLGSSVRLFSEPIKTTLQLPNRSSAGSHNTSSPEDERSTADMLLHHQPTRCYDSAIFGSIPLRIPPTRPGAIKPVHFREWRSRVIRHYNLSVSSATDDKPYIIVVDRVKAQRRLIVNIQTVVRHLENLGLAVKVVDWQGMPLKEQLQLAVNAIGMVGTHGNGFVWSCLMRPGSPLVELGSDVVDHNLVGFGRNMQNAGNVAPMCGLESLSLRCYSKSNKWAKAGQVDHYWKNVDVIVPKFQINEMELFLRNTSVRLLIESRKTSVATWDVVLSPWNIYPATAIEIEELLLLNATVVTLKSTQTSAWKIAKVTPSVLIAQGKNSIYLPSSSEPLEAGKQCDDQALTDDVALVAWLPSLSAPSVFLRELAGLVALQQELGLDPATCPVYLLLSAEGLSVETVAEIVGDTLEKTREALAGSPHTVLLDVVAQSVVLLGTPTAVANMSSNATSSVFLSSRGLIFGKKPRSDCYRRVVIGASLQPKKQDAAVLPQGRYVPSAQHRLEMALKVVLERNEVEATVADKFIETVRSLPLLKEGVRGRFFKEGGVPLADCRLRAAHYASLRKRIAASFDIQDVYTEYLSLSLAFSSAALNVAEGTMASRFSLANAHEIGQKFEIGRASCRERV